MKRVILVILAIFFTTNLLAHSTNINFDSKANCTKKKSMSSVQHVRLPIFFFAFLFGSAECTPYHTEYILGISSDSHHPSLDS